MSVERRYGVHLTAAEIAVVADALLCFYPTCDENEAEDVDRLHQFFGNLHETAMELEHRPTPTTNQEDGKK